MLARSGVFHGDDGMTVIGVGHDPAAPGLASRPLGGSLGRRGLDHGEGAAEVLQSDTSIVLQCGNTKVMVTPDGVSINGKTLTFEAGSTLKASSPDASLALDSGVAILGKEVTASSTGARLALACDAKLTGSKVQLGSGSGKSAAASSSGTTDDRLNKPVFIRTRLLRAGRPAAGVPYSLMLDGTIEHRSAARADGMIEQRVPASVASAVLTLLDTGERRTFTVGAVEPIETILGAQTRLQRLGLYQGPIDGEAGPLTVHAIALFQRTRGLSGSGRIDAATAQELKKAYGS